MSWNISEKVREILRKGSDFEGIDRDEALELLRLDLHSPEVYALTQTANEMSRYQFGNKGESHFHIGLNVAPCKFNCSFCSLTVKAGIFTEEKEFPQENILGWAKQAEENGADALNLMTTGTFGFERLIEIGRLLSKQISIPLVANTRDMSYKEAELLLDAGFVGAYHAVRLGEGKDTPFKRESRINTIRILNDVGLTWMNCVEPVGPEHDQEEIVDLMFLAREYKATYSGVMRRINFPGSPKGRYGMISELELARMVAVSRLVMGSIPKAHCTHEPNILSLISGANLLFPEVGSSPRDSEPDTSKGRGWPIMVCREMHKEALWDPDLPSNCFEVNLHSMNQKRG